MQSFILKKITCSMNYSMNAHLMKNVLFENHSRKWDIIHKFILKKTVENETIKNFQINEFYHFLEIGQKKSVELNSRLIRVMS